MTTPSKTAEAVERLKPCPLCGNTDIYVAPDEVGSGGQWAPPVHVGCRECCLDLVDLKTDTREGAIAAWNQRTAQQPDARVREALEAAWTGRTHDLKTWPTPYDAVAAGLKPWELRLNDRDYQVGDRLRLRRWVPVVESYSGEATTRQVTWLLKGPAFGLPEGYVIMSLASLTAHKPEEGEADPPLTFDFARGLPGGKLDDSTYEQIEATLDKIDAPIRDGSRWLTLPERIAALASPPDAQPRIEALEKALEPFADFAGFLALETEGFADADELVLSTFDHEMTRFKFGDFRRARAALKAEEKG